MKNYKFILLFSTIALAVITFWGPNFLTPDTYSNYGDTAFSLRPDYVNTYLYMWDTRGAFGLGYPSLFPPYLPSYFLVYLWSILGLPLWIANRLWYIVPDIFIGLGAFYLYKSLFRGKYSWICGTICSIFIMLLPEKFIIPVYELGFAGTMFALGSFIRGLFAEESKNYKKGLLVVMFSLGIMLSIQCFRYLYLTLIIMLMTVVFALFFYRKKKEEYRRIFKFISFCAILTLVLNLFWIVPLVLQLGQQKESLVPNSEILTLRETFSQEHQKMTNPLYILRASTGGAGLGRPPYYYFSHPFILPFSFIIPLYCFLPLLLKTIDRKIKVLVFISVALTLYPVSFHLSPPLNMFLRKCIPGFWVMANPQYWAYYIAVCYGLIIGSTSEHFLNSLDMRRNKWTNNIYLTPKILKFIFIGFISITVIIFGGGVLLDKPLVPGFVSPFFLYGNKLPFVKIPAEYDALEKYLSQHAKEGERIWYIDTGGYKEYAWSYKGHMPEIVFFKSPIPAIGRPLSYATPMVNLLSDSFDAEKYSSREGLNLALFLAKTLNIRYIILHKDYLYQPDAELVNCAKENIENSNSFSIIMNTDKFVLYENKNILFGAFYSSKDSYLVTKGITAIPLISQMNLSDDEKPVFISTSNSDDKKPDLKNEAWLNSKFIFYDATGQDLAIEFSGPEKIYLLEGQNMICNIDKLGVYNIYLDLNDIRNVKEKISTFTIEFDTGVSVTSEISKSAYSRYVKIGQVKFDRAGKHKIKLKTQDQEDGEGGNKKLKIILVDKEEEQAAKILLLKNINQPKRKPSYVFTQEREFYVP